MQNKRMAMHFALIILFALSACGKPIDPVPATRPPPPTDARPAELAKFNDCTERASRMGRIKGNKVTPLSPDDRDAYIWSCFRSD